VIDARLVRASVAVVGVVVLAVLVWGLTRPQPRAVGGNGVPPSQFVINLAPRAVVCSPLGRATRDADAVEATLGTYGRPAQPLRLSVNGSSRVTTGYRSGVVTLGLPAGAARGGDRACVRNLGTARVAIAGVHGGGSVVNGRGRPFGLSLALVDTDPPSWWNRTPTLVAHVGDAPGAPLGSATGWVAALMFALGLVGALLLAGRSLSR
jgi:hypothetical protein